MKSFHSTAEAFKPFVSPKDDLPKQEVKSEEKQPDLFGMSDSFMDSLLSDPLFKGEIDKLVEKLATEKAHTELETYRKQVEEQAKKEGFEAGQLEAKRTVEFQCQKLETIATEFLGEKEALLKQHEPQWLRALSHLLDRFMVPGKNEILKTVEDWLSTSVDQLQAKEKVTIHLPEKEHAALTCQLGTADHKGWRVVMDPSLKEGEIRFESPGGAMFFSPHAEREKLDALLNQFLKDESCSKPV